MGRGAVVLAVLVLVLAAGGIFLLITSSQHQAAMEQARAELEQARAEAMSIEDVRAQAATELDVLRADNHALENEKAELVKEKAALQARLEELQEQLAAELPSFDSEAVAPTAEPEAGGGLPIPFGDWESLEALTAADWGEMAQAVEEMRPLILEILELMEAGKEGEIQPLQIQVARINQRLVGFALDIIGKVPTHAPANGEFTHPITLANLSASMLERQGEPLTAGQRAALQRLGEDYEKGWDDRQAGYGDATLQVAKVVDELELKQQFMKGLHRQLTATQEEALQASRLQDRARLDVLSPSIMLVASSPPLSAPSPEELKQKYRQSLERDYGVSSTILDDMSFVLDRWLQEVQPDLKPISDGEVPFYTTDQAVVAGRAHARVLQDLLSAESLSEDARTRLLKKSYFPVPRLTRP